MRTLLNIFVCLLVLGGGAVATWYILETEPKAEREGAVRQSAMLVEVIPAEVGTYEPEIVALGTVEPARDIHVRPLVSGEIVYRDPVFTPGGLVEAGEVLVRIDPADYENVVAQRQSELAQSEADLAIERGRQDIARRDLEMLPDSARPRDTALALREPQLDAARARVKSAQAALRQAELELARTEVRAPFAAQILTRSTDLGTQVGRGDDLGRIVCVDEYWVVAAVPQTMLRWITFPDDDGAASQVRIRNRAAWPAGQYREGTVHRLVGALDEATRMARVLVVVPDPLARDAGAGDRPKMIVGSVVQARIAGRTLEDVIRVHRDHMRSGDTVWTMVDGQLAVRKVEVAFRDAQHAYVASGLEPGAEIVTTDLATSVDGALLRTEAEGAAADEAEPVDEAQDAGEGDGA